MRTVDAVQRERWMRMNALGQLVEVVEPAAYGGGSLSVAGDVETSYDYDARGDLTSVRQGPSRQQRDIQYDSLGRLTAQYLPEKNRSLSDSGAYVGANNGHWSDVYAYDDNSNLTLRVDARGVQTHYNYAWGAYPIDPLNRLQDLSYSFAAGSDSGNISPCSAVSFEYMSSGDVTRPEQIAVSQGASESWLYDSFGRVGSRTVGYGGALQLSEVIQYDSLNRPTHVTQPADNGTRTLDYSYDIGGMLKSLTVDGVAYASNMFYDLAGHTASADIGPSGALQTTETSHFDPATGRLSSQVVQRGNGLPLLLNLSYAYHPSGQLHESNDGNAQRTYTYDAVARLQQVDDTDPQNKTWTEAYQFDPYGNRLSVTATAGMPPDGIPSIAYDPMTNHAVGATYDEAGNQQQFQLDGPDLFAWYDQAGRMVKVTNRAGTKTLESIGYGPDGHKLFSQVGAQTAYYFWDGNDVVATYTQSSGDTSWKWAKSAIFLGRRRLATILPGTVLYHHPDHIGTRLITNDKDTTTIYQETLPFGTLIAGNSPDPVNPIFTSYDRSAATGLDDAVNREFNPGQSFTQPDLMGMSAASPDAPQSPNLYAYALNDPVNNTDPSGLEIHHQSYRDGPGGGPGG